MQKRSNDLDLDKCAAAIEACACFNFRKASRVVTQFFDEALQPAGVRSTQLVILLAIAVNDRSNSARLARKLVMDRSTLVRNLRPLERRGLLKLSPGQDRRTRIISLTKRGRETLARSIPFWEEAQKKFVEQIGAQRWQRLLNELPKAVALTRSVVSV